MKSFACSIALLITVAAGAAEPRWHHLSSSTGDLPTPGPSTEQTGAGRPDILDKTYNWETPRVDIWLQLPPE